MLINNPEVTGSLYVTGSVTSTGGFTGSLQGTASFATSASFALRNLSSFTKGVTIVNNFGLNSVDTGSFPVWRANTACSASQMLIYRSGGTGATVNITKNGSNINVGVFSSSVADTWLSSSALQSQGFGVGDRLEINLTSFTGSVTEVTVQVDFTTLI